MNIDNKRVGRNLNALILKHNIKQSRIVEETGIDKSTISKYINGSLRISKNHLKMLSEYFNVTQESLLNGDYTRIKGDFKNPEEFCRNCYKLLPVFFEEGRYDDSHFLEAHEKHRQLFDKLKNDDSDIDDIDIDSIQDEYKLAMQDEKAKYVSIANYLSITFLKLFIMKGTAAIQSKDYNELSLQIRKNIILSPEEHLDFQKDFNGAEEEYRNYVTNEGFLGDLIDYFDILKNNPYWNILADYYICLQFIADAFPNNFTAQQNEEFGATMLIIFAACGNQFADNFVTLLLPE